MHQAPPVRRSALLAAAAFVTDMAEHRAPMPTLLDYAVYLALPFKLLAGPLEPPRLIEQIRRWRFCVRPARLLAAWPWLAVGLFMKYGIANRLDPARNLVFVDPVSSLATAAIFELKFYFDFAGYSFMAFAGAMALGLRITGGSRVRGSPGLIALLYRGPDPTAAVRAGGDAPSDRC